jgi:hypothetical protein
MPEDKPRSAHATVIAETMGRFAALQLRRSSGGLVTSRPEAVKIALATAEKHAPAQPGPGVRRALRAIADVAPGLASKAQPATREQLSLLHVDAVPADDHEWEYLGQEAEAPHAALSACRHCPVRRREVTRFVNTLVTYAADANAAFKMLRPACRRASARGNS